MSIFSLKTSTNELTSSNNGMSKMKFEQHPATRDVTGQNYPNGSIHFRFETSGSKWWIPSKSYIRMRARLRKGDGTQLDTADATAPNMSLMSNLFQSGEMRINDKVVSRVSDFMAQVDAVETRLTKSKSWIDSIGASSNWWQESASLRAAEVASDGTIVKDTVAVVPADTTTTRAAMGFDAAGGALADRNQWAYTEATGALVYARGTDGNGLAGAAASTAFPVGSYFKFVGVANTPEVEMKVLENDGAGNLVVEPLLNVDVATDGRNDFAKVVKNTIVAPASRRIDEFEMIWTPPLSLFKVDHALPAGRYELVLNPQTSASYQLRAIESVGADKTAWTTSANGDFRFEVLDMYLYTHTVEGPRADNMTYLLDLEQTNCQSEKIDSVSFQQKNFDVSPSTYALTAAFQDLRAGTSTQISPSKLRSYDVGIANETGIKLNRFFVNYAGQNLPAPDADPSFVPPKDYTTQRYMESQIYSGAAYDTGGAETQEEWVNRGAYHYISFPKDATDRSTRVNVHTQFESGTDVANMRLLLFSHSRSVARIQIADGRVTSVEVEQA